MTASCLTPKDSFREGSIGLPFPDTYYAIVCPGTDDVLPAGEEGEIILRGHTHIPEKSLISGVMHLNPGSVSLPKGGSAASYMVYADCIFTWKTLDGSPFDEYRAVPRQPV